MNDFGEVEIGRIYSHYKGGKYKVINVTHDVETKEKYVTVININDPKEKLMGVLYDLFCAEIDPDENYIGEYNQRFHFQPTVVKVKTVDDEIFVKDMQKQVKENGGYCPCMIVKSDDTKCMCKEFRQMYEGTCHCGVYAKTLEVVKM